MATRVPTAKAVSQASRSGSSRNFTATFGVAMRGRPRNFAWAETSTMSTEVVNGQRGKGNFKYPAYKFLETE